MPVGINNEEFVVIGGTLPLGRRE